MTGVCNISVIGTGQQYSAAWPALLCPIPKEWGHKPAERHAFCIAPGPEKTLEFENAGLLI